MSWTIAVGNVESVQATWKEAGIAIVNAAFSVGERYVVIGEDCDWTGFESLDRLDKTFVIWDRQLQQIWMIRDRVGQKTLYYTRTGETRWISPRLRSLNAYHSRELDLVALRDYLSCAFVPGSQTLWQQVREVRPGTYRNFQEETIYWSPQEQIQNSDASLEWHGQKVRSLLEGLIEEMLPSGEPVGAFLSGGIDSSCVTALAAKLHDRAVHTYSIHFGAPYPSELEFANLVAKHCHTQHHILEISPEMIWQMLPETLASLDDPIGEGLTVPNLVLARAAKESVNVVLNGEGGDPCFAGPKNKPMLLNQLYGSGGSKRDVEAYLTSFQKCFSDLPTLLKPEVYAAIAQAPSVFESDLNVPVAYLNRLMLLNLKFKGADYILTKVNALNAAAGITGRSPLFDPRMVELSLQIPPQYKLAGAEEKAVLKAAVADLLPDVIVNRPKSGMIMSMQQWFRTIWRRRARALLLDRKAEIAPYINQAIVKDWLDYRGQVWHRYGLKLWLLVTLEIWLRVNR
ncbi:asparagine synthase-related protein [Leptolyngbya boryana CZ1]|uniref:asparagine synthase (glutamine-hydrolyzing) n=1 Tax=Leptolyngbya boryana CZ1 TaxID=3060204 RepID=A0AA96WSE8_LEPBY|nr:asparagine synthase-related protein [Leptolyngbya boryana]WNZ44732.1 asparagine synthase-related protein [Leptolyngbya boryana CZ1]